MATERLYYNDSHLVEFEAHVMAVSERVSGWTAVTLDRTAFYPTGGGQPSDRGHLDGARVVECIDDPKGVLHIVQGRAPEVGATVTGHVDWERRLDHIQQHTGQHILSAAFVSLLDAETRSFRMMDQSSEIDIDLDTPTQERLERAFDLANKIIWDDRAITIRNVTDLEAATLPLRKESEREGALRLIEIKDFDLSACGGTHAIRTGEVGIVALRSWERAKGLTRVEFVAGRRVLSDYRIANQIGRTVAAMFSVGRDDTPASVSKLLDENKHQARRLRDLEEIAARVEAEDLLASAVICKVGSKLITHIFENRDADSLKRLAQQLITHANTIALLASRDSDTARLVFARSSEAPGDMNALMREACALLDGRGGGKPDMAQGGGKNVSGVTEMMEGMRSSLIAMIE
jgi:alanyl-tRNA synthetase